MSQQSTSAPAQKWTTFYLDSLGRDFILSRYTFYLDQAKERLFPQFDDIEGQSRRYSDKWYEDAGQRFNPDIHDADAFVEKAWDEGINYGLMLEDMRNDIYLALLAGLYHRWDKDLREWVVRELAHWIERERVEKKIWNVQRHILCQLLDSLGIPVTSQPFYPLLDAYGKLVNVYKHGKGSAFDSLRGSHPEYFRRDIQSDAYWKYTAHDDLAVSDEQFKALTDTLYAFWGCIPQYTSSEDALDEIPKWFIQIIESD